LILAFTFKNQSTSKTKAMCCKWRRERKTTEAVAWGVGKRTKSLWVVVEFCVRGNKLIKNQPFSFSIENKKRYFWF
jgi:hypothetical protein